MPAGSNMVVKLNRAGRRVIRMLGSLHTRNIAVLALNRCLTPDHRRLPIRHCIPPTRFSRLGRVTLRLKFARTTYNPFIQSVGIVY